MVEVGRRAVPEVHDADAVVVGESSVGPSLLRRFSDARFLSSGERCFAKVLVL